MVYKMGMTPSARAEALVRFTLCQMKLISYEGHLESSWLQSRISCVCTFFDYNWRLSFKFVPWFRRYFDNRRTHTPPCPEPEMMSRTKSSLKPGMWQWRQRHSRQTRRRNMHLWGHHTYEDVLHVAMETGCCWRPDSFSSSCEMMSIFLWDDV